MSQIYLIRLGSIKNRKLPWALKHNKRESEEKDAIAQNIDKARSCLNYSLVDDLNSHHIINNIKNLIRARQIKQRKNAVMGVEIIFSLPIDWHQKDSKEYFNDCFNWVIDSFDGLLISFDVHLDEAAPHAHAIIFPLIGDKLQGNRLIGDKTNLGRLNADFFCKVASRYGFTKNQRVSALNKKNIEQRVLDRLRYDSVMTSVIWAVVRNDIHKNPVSYASILGISLDEKILLNKSL